MVLTFSAKCAIIRGFGIFEVKGGVSMRKYYIADVLTALKLLPAVGILTLISRIDSSVVFLLFAAGELLDALDGMAAKKWPHPPETNRLWFRRHIKLLESGLDILLGIAALIYIMVRIDYLVGLIIILAAGFFGTLFEIVLYGRLFGTPEKAKSWSLYAKKPNLASRLVGFRLLVYLACVGAILMILLWSTELMPVSVCVVITILVALIALILAIKKTRDGRMRDVINFLK